MVTLQKGYTPTVAITDNLIGSKYNIQFASKFVEVPEAKSGAKPSEYRKLYKCRDGVTKAKAWIHTNIGKLTGLNPKGDVSGDFARRAKPKDGFLTRMFNTCFQGFFRIYDPDNSDFKERCPGFVVNISCAWDEDDLVDEALLTEVIQMAISELTSGDGATSRIGELMTGAMLIKD